MGHWLKFRDQRSTKLLVLTIRLTQPIQVSVVNGLVPGRCIVLSCPIIVQQFSDITHTQTHTHSYFEGQNQKTKPEMDTVNVTPPIFVTQMLLFLIIIIFFFLPWRSAGAGVTSPSLMLHI